MIAPRAGDVAHPRLGLLQEADHHPYGIPQQAAVTRLVHHSAEVTVLSSRTTLPSSIFSCRALVSSIRLIASQVSARIALIVLCSTDFLGLHAHGRRAKARNEAESSRWKANSS